jgi:hypothetical protein
MFEGQQCRLRKTGNAWEVEIGPDLWHAFSSKKDADLVATAGQLFCQVNPSQNILRDTIKAMESAGIAQHPDVMVLYDKLILEHRKRKPKK